MKKELITLITANYPSMKDTVKNGIALAKGGADMVGLGVPFSDPNADGLTIQKADAVALKNMNFPIHDVFKGAKEIHNQTGVPLILSSYANVVYQYGYDKFCSDCSKSGVKDLIIPDLSYEEEPELLPTANKYGVDVVVMVSPNSKDRVKPIAKRAKGLIYLFSFIGALENVPKSLSKIVKNIRKYTRVPVVVGNSVETKYQAKSVANVSDGVFMDSVCDKLIAKYHKNSPEHLKAFVKDIKNTINA